MLLHDVIADIGSKPRTSVIYVREGSVPVTGATEVILVHDGEAPPDGWTYLLELWIAQEVLEVWSAWRDERTPSLAEACEAVVFYAENDAYLSDEDEDPS
ncbi:hypothetical protein [Cellulomonas cellasea]|uniref:Uncharacterized protein n=2 Tax=Cellulomonas cellasea TaxID=43670 RepID=A0A0A0B590_9CELL|nr:hypothetical protein [Cellulomonas cellasea]KGM01357.1 hypothetical protein Q760_01895 [Cellulomonas cellasea DSM 20118]GEA89536.1 hypothetical protein CCE01nite_34850 [Cellulomonas cellasea]